MHQSSSSRPSHRDHHFDLSMTQQPKSSCHFLVLLTFDHLHSLMLLAYDNSIWCALEVHNGDSRQTWFVLRPLCDLGRDFPLASNLTTNWLRGLFCTLWSATIFFFSTFAFSTVGATTIGSLAFTNFISLEMFTAKLLSPVYPNPFLSEKVF